jgi:hypothetical protein
MSDQWYYIRNGQRYGPVPADELARLAATGTLQAHGSYDVGGGPTQVAVADVNGDGALDLLAVPAPSTIPSTAP